VTVDRRIAFASLPLGPLLTMVGYAAMMLSHARITDPMLVGLVTFPTALLLTAAALAVLLHRDRDATRWISVAIGTAAGTVVTVVVVVGGISLLAWMLSDPA
jgi:hypothetical protein